MNTQGCRWAWRQPLPPSSVWCRQLCQTLPSSFCLSTSTTSLSTPRRSTNTWNTWNDSCNGWQTLVWNWKPASASSWGVKSPILATRSRLMEWVASLARWSVCRTGQHQQRQQSCAAFLALLVITGGSSAGLPGLPGRSMTWWATEPSAPRRRQLMYPGFGVPSTKRPSNP